HFAFLKWKLNAQAWPWWEQSGNWQWQGAVGSGQETELGTKDEEPGRRDHETQLVAVPRLVESSGSTRRPIPEASGEADASPDPRSQSHHHQYRSACVDTNKTG